MRNPFIQSETPSQQVNAATLFEHALDVRKMLERAWSAETAYQGIVVQPDDPISRGQCGVSSVWLSRYLLNLGLDAKFTEGIIHLRNDTDEHVWVEVRGVTNEPLVVDITSDQYRTALGTIVHVGNYADSDETIGRYTPEQYFDPYDIPRKKLMGRVALLEANIARLPWRHRLRMPQ